MPQDEYVLQEQDDALEALEWIASQDWCSGNTGMFGMSWGAFSALQVAARKPPSLKAIIPVHGTDDRFADDIHYKGGCLLGAGLSWGSLYTLYMMRPPDPEISGETWREIWLTRFDECPLLLPEWMSHQSDDDYWRQGSISVADNNKPVLPAPVVHAVSSVILSRSTSIFDKTQSAGNGMPFPRTATQSKTFVLRPFGSACAATTLRCVS